MPNEQDIKPSDIRNLLRGRVGFTFLYSSQINSDMAKGNQVTHLDQNGEMHTLCAPIDRFQTYIHTGPDL